MQFKLPELGEGVHEGELVKWKVRPGDTVKFDQPLCEIMTDKATVEIPSAFQGKVAELHAKEGESVKVGQLMLSFEGAAAGASAQAQAHAAPAAASRSSEAPAPGPVPAMASAARAEPKAAPTGLAAQSAALETTGMQRIPAAPSTRRLAREHGLNLAQVPATGPAGRVLREDVERWLSGDATSMGRTGTGATAAGLASPATAALRRGMIGEMSEERVPFRGLRKKISEKMRLSKDKAAHFTYVEEADATQLVQLRAMAKEVGARDGVKVTYLPFIMKAMVAGLRHFPIMNSSLDEERGELVLKHYYNIGLSIQTEEGLTAPVVKDVAHKSVLELAREIQDLVDRARAKRLTQEDFQGSTITLTNAGSIGGLFATPVINYPEVAILGFNKIFRKPVVVNEGGKETIAIRDWTYFSLSLDHRVVDGAVGAEFMNLFVKYIQNPSLLLLDSF